MRVNLPVFIYRPHRGTRPTSARAPMPAYASPHAHRPLEKQTAAVPSQFRTHRTPHASLKSQSPPSPPRPQASHVQPAHNKPAPATSNAPCPNPPPTTRRHSSLRRPSTPPPPRRGHGRLPADPSHPQSLPYPSTAAARPRAKNNSLLPSVHPLPTPHRGLRLVRRRTPRVLAPPPDHATPPPPSRSSTTTRTGTRAHRPAAASAPPPR